MGVPPIHELDRLGDRRGDANNLEITLFAEKNAETLGNHGVVVDDADPDSLPHGLLGVRFARRFHKSDDLTLGRRVHVFDIVQQQIRYSGACPLRAPLPRQHFAWWITHLVDWGIVLP